MPQMKPMIWILIMMFSLTMIILTIIMNFFSSLFTMQSKFDGKIKLHKWKW